MNEEGPYVSEDDWYYKWMFRMILIVWGIYIILDLCGVG